MDTVEKHISAAISVANAIKELDSIEKLNVLIGSICSVVIVSCDRKESIENAINYVSVGIREACAAAWDQGKALQLSKKTPAGRA
jgi:hypothetical protein